MSAKAQFVSREVVVEQDVNCLVCDACGWWSDVAAKGTDLLPVLDGWMKLESVTHEKRERIDLCPACVVKARTAIGPKPEEVTTA